MIKTWADGIKSRLGQKRLEKELAKNKSHRDFINYKDVKTIGLLYDATSDEVSNAVKKYAKILEDKEKKEVHMLGFINKNEKLENLPPDIRHDYFTRRNLNWLMLPDTPSVKEFVNETFDVLINVNPNRTFPLNYISGVSKAHCRVGMYTEGDEPFHDLMVGHYGITEIKKFFEQVNHYLLEVKK